MGNYAVLGATSWGVTLAHLLASNGHGVTVLTRDRVEADAVAGRRGIQRLPEVVLPAHVAVEATPHAGGPFDGLVAVVPAQALRTSLEALPGLRDVPVLSAAKSS